MNKTRNGKENIPMNFEEYKTRKADLKPQSVSRKLYLSMTSSSTTEEAGISAMSAHYLLSPLETLDESLIDSHEERIDLHDLTETYNLLATRIKEILLKGPTSDQAATPLTLLAERSHVLMNALRRDIMRVMINPCMMFEKEKTGRETMALDEVQYARNLALLGQQAIRVTSDLFAFPQLYSTMTVDQLRLLLKDVLAILSEPSLPTPHSRRTFGLLRWILQVQKLPYNVLSPHNSNIMVCVKRSLEGEREQVNVDGLKILAELLRNNPKLFLGPACNLFCDTLKFLVVESTNLRSAAAHAISAFAYAKVLQNLPFSPKQKVSYELSRALRKFSIEYIEGESSSQIPSLINLLQSSLQDPQLSSHSTGPQWVAVIIASFIVLIDTPLFDSRTLLKIKDLLWQFSDHSSATVRLLHTPVWKCLVWTFARIPADEEKSRKVQTVISQDLRNGTGALLSHVILNLNGKDMISRVLDVMTCMFDDKPSRQDGVVLLCQLLSSSRPPRSGTGVISTLHQQLFDGKILDSHLVDLIKHTVTVYDSTVVRDIVRQLRIEETIEHWDKLLELWAEGVRTVLKYPTPEAQKSILAAWQTLLRADSEFCQSQGQVGPSPKAAYVLGRLCDEFAYKTSDVSVELKQIRFLRILWQVVQRSFSQSSLKDISNILLTTIVQRDFQISDVAVGVEWSKLCQMIVMYSTSSEGSPGDGSSLVTQTWEAVARMWAAIDNVSGDSLVTFLKFVFPERIDTGEGLELWKKLLRKALTEYKTRVSARDFCCFLSSVWKTFATDDHTLALAFPKQFHALLSAFVIPFNHEVPELVLPFLDNILCSSYSPDHSLIISLEYINMIHEMISAVPEPDLVSCISALRRSLCCWMEDLSTLVPNGVYCQNIFPLYEYILQRIRLEEPNERTLCLLWKVFLSPIERPVPSREAIKAFEAFWFATYHNKDFLFEPDLIRYLKGLDMALGVGLAAGLTQSDDSQGTAGSFVPETQSLEPVSLTGSQILERYFDTFAQGDKTNDLDIVPPSSSFMRDFGTAPPGGPSGQPIPMPLEDQDRNHNSPSPPPRVSKRKRTEDIEDIVEETPAATSSICILQSLEEVVPESEEQLRTPTKLSRKTSVTHTSRSYIRESQLMTPEPSAPPSSYHGHVDSSDRMEEGEDYGSWENATVSPRTLAQISREIDASDINVVKRDRFDTDDRDDEGAILDSPSVRAAKRRKASPTTGISSASNRNRRRVRTTSAKVLQLQEALQAFMDDIDTPVEDLAKASELVQEFVTEIDKKLSARTRSRTSS